MSLAAARQTLSSTARASLRRTSAFRTGARRLNSSQASDHKPKSDRPWIIASAVVFGPAFLYLASPTARQKAKHVHHDAHDYPGQEAKAIANAHAPTPAAAGGVKEQESVPPTTSAIEQQSEGGKQEKGESEKGEQSEGESESGAIRMKDDEGREVDVSASLKKEEAADVPKADRAPVPETIEAPAETEETSSKESKEAPPKEAEEKSS